MHTIAMNAGAEGAVVVGELLKTEDPQWGHNAATGEYCNMIQAGIIDPTKVCTYVSSGVKNHGCRRGHRGGTFSGFVLFCCVALRCVAHQKVPANLTCA